MDTQNTPVHSKLWHRDFWLLAFTNLLLSMAVYMLIPILPNFLMEVRDLSTWQVGVVMGVYSIGLFALGPLCNWLIQRYRRNRVCLWSVLLMAATLTLYTHGHQWFGTILSHDVFFYAFSRFVLGATFGLSQMILCSTLIIDVSESFKRTEANHSAAWFGRMALALGPIVAVALDTYVAGGDFMTFDVSAICAVAAFVLILLVNFPFKIPDENVSRFSLDRFFLPSAWIAFVNLVVITTVLGVLMTMKNSLVVYIMLLVGFVIALLAERFVLRNVEDKTKTVMGLTLMLIALLILMYLPDVAIYVTPVFIGFGLSLVGSSFLSYFILLSMHCQRGTSQSSFFLAWECGIGLGSFLGYSLLPASEDKVSGALVIVIIGFVMYKFVTCPWCMRHKNR